MRELCISSIASATGGFQRTTDGPDPYNPTVHDLELFQDATLSDGIRVINFGYGDSNFSLFYDFEGNWSASTGNSTLSASYDEDGDWSVRYTPLDGVEVEVTGSDTITDGVRVTGTVIIPF